MGRDKRLEQIEGETLLERAVRIVSQVTLSSFVVAREDPMTSAGFVPDELDIRGALAGVEAALRHAETRQVLVLACDYPLIEATTLRKVVDAAQSAGEEFDLTIPKIGGWSHPLVAVWSTGLHDMVLERVNSGQLRVMDLVAAARVQHLTLADLGCNQLEFLNINEPADLQLARRIAGERRLQSHR